MSLEITIDVIIWGVYAVKATLVVLQSDALKLIRALPARAPLTPAGGFN